MITELKLSNFRLFDDEVTVRFRPITILIGENNAGKSSVIKFLLMLKQSAHTPGRSFLTTNGEETTLGKFSKLKNEGSRKPNLDFSLKANENGSPSDYVFEYLKAKKLQAHDLKRFYKMQATIAYNRKNMFLGKEQKVTFSAGNKKVMEITEEISPNSTLLRFESKPRSMQTDSELAENPIRNLCLESILSDIAELRHLSAMREELKGEIRADSFSTGQVGKRGENTILELWQEILDSKEKKDTLINHTRSVLNIGDITFTEFNELAACNARNEKTTIRTNISDFGFGVSQCMPIFVQGLLMPPMSHLIVEQPEAQVHPTAQIGMGSFFADLWKKHKVGSIIETHSDNILLRLRRLIAKGKLEQNDVSVAFFAINKQGKSTVKNLDIEQDGSMEDGLPIEFFHASIGEALKMGAGK